VSTCGDDDFVGDWTFLLLLAIIQKFWSNLYPQYSLSHFHVYRRYEGVECTHARMPVSH